MHSLKVTSIFKINIHRDLLEALFHNCTRILSMKPTITATPHNTPITTWLAAVSCLLLGLFLNEAAAVEVNLWVDDGVTISSYDGFSVLPVENLTGEVFDFDVAGILEKYLKEKLRSDNLTELTASLSGKKVILIKTQLTLYQTGSALKRWVGLFGQSAAATCVIRVMLVDGNSGQLVGDMVIARNVTVGFIGAPGSKEDMLKDVAEDAIAAIHNRILNEQGKL